MVASISKPLNQETLEKYHSKDNYYSQGQGLQNSQWQGQFSIEQGLHGEIKSADWKHACAGKDPQGEELRRKQINSRAGWDITLSACKSASLKALVDQDRVVLAAHRKAVLETVQYIESNCIYAQVKASGKLTREQTQKGQFALFEHDDNRKQEPQLHTHVVILNQTQCADGKPRTLDSRELFIQKKTIGAYYDHAFAHELQKQGFELDWTSDHTFEIKGYQKEQLEAFSGRRQQIREHLAKQNIQLEQATAEQKAIACLESRPIKVHKLEPIDHEMQRLVWKQESDRLGIIHPQPAADLQQLYALTPHPGSLHQVIQDGIDSATAYQVAVTRQELLRHCLRQTQAHYSPVEIERSLDQSSALIPTQDGRLTTQRSLQREQFILTAANDGQNTQLALADAETITAIVQRYELNEGQTAGLIHLATSTDFITLLQGNAGVGKTYTLKALRDCLPPEQRDKLRGLTPSAAAAETLTTEANIPATTLDRYLLMTEELPPGDILLVDEAGMVSAQKMERLIQKAQETQSRLILVGDTKQLSSIEAGAPFRLLQGRSELKTVTIEQNIRQKAPHLFIAADLAAQRRTDEALTLLERCSCIQEIPDVSSRNQSVVSQYLTRTPQEQAQTLILCDTNSDRQDITAQIRADYLAEGRLSETSRTIALLYPKRLDPQAIAQGFNYQPGDVIHFRRVTKAFPEAYYRVVAVQEQSLILKDRSGQSKELRLHQHKERDVFECQPLEIRVGDRLRFTRNHRTWNQTNGQPYTIEALNPDGTIEIRTKGQRYQVTADQLLHSDYAYCRTVYSAQGWTSKAAIWAPGKTPGQEQTYVALTRAQENLEILTLDRAALLASATQSHGQENAIELLTPQLPIPTSPVSQSTSKEAAIDPQPETEPSETILDPQQLTLFPGQTDEPQRKPTRQRRTQPPAKSGRPLESDRGTAQPSEQTPQSDAETEPAADTLTPEQPFIPARSRLAEFADAFGALAEQLDPHRPETRSERGDGSDFRNYPEPGANPEQPDHNPEPGVSESSSIGDPTAAIDPAAQQSERPATELDHDDPDGLAAGETADSRPGESLESDSSPVERQGIEYPIDPDHLSRNDPQRQSVEFVADRHGLEREVLIPTGADERTIEQHRTSAEEAAQTEVGETEALIAIASQWSDTELLDYEQQVKEYFKTILPEPDWEEGKRLQIESNRWSTEYHQAGRVYRDCQEEVKRLGEPRSLWYPFGSPRQEVEAARGRADESYSELALKKMQLDQSQGKLKKWKTSARQYQEWRHSDRGEQMHQVKAIVEMQPVQERIQQVQREQEAIRQAQERQRRRQEVLERLQQWQQIAIRLGRPEGYVLRVQEVIEDFRQGGKLSEKAIEAMKQDYGTYQQQQLVQTRQQQRQRGLSL